MKNKMIFRLTKALFIIFAFHSFFVTFANAHTFHTSLTVLDYNAETKSVEITMQLFTHDLVQVLEKKHKKRIDLEKKENEQLIFDYLKENFFLRNAEEVSLKLNWVGKELEIDKIYIYLEIPIEGSLEGKKLQNTIFFESFEEQTNLVICKFEQKKADLLFKVGDKLKEIQVDNKGEKDN